MSDLAKRFGEELREARIGDGYTSRTLGARVGASEKLVLSWEHGKSLPTFKHYAQLIRMWPSLPRYAPRDEGSKEGGNHTPRTFEDEDREKIGTARARFWERYGF